MRARWSTLETLLAAALLAVLALDIYYFILIPQDWTLRDDYGFVLAWTRPGVNVWQLGWNHLETIMGMGRFQPVDALSRTLHYGLLPVTPRAFHVSFFVLAAVALAATWQFLRCFELSRARILLALLVITSNLAFKEWLTTLSVSESLATTFLMLALALYVSNTRWGSKWLAVPCFALSFCSKESFFLFCGAFPLLELTYFGDRKPTLKKFAPALAAVTLSAVFILFVKTLPNHYAAGLSFTKLFSLGAVLKSFVLPPLRSFGPALLLVLLGLARPRSLTRKERALALTGLWLIVPFTLFINAWGPFDSWFYLHTVIPFGWAFLLAAVWRPRENAFELAGAAAVLVFAVLSTANGGRNYSSYFSTAKTMAELVADDAATTSGLRVYSNCAEGSAQLMAYLQLAHPNVKPIKIENLAAARQLSPAQARGSYDVLLSTKCDPFDVASLHAQIRQLNLGAWTLFKVR